MDARNSLGDLDPNEQRIAWTIVTLVASAFVLYALISLLAYSQVTWSLQVIGVILGFVAGPLISFPFTRRELRLLAEKGEIRKGLKSRILNSLVFIIFIGFFDYLLFSGLPLELLIVFWEFVAAFLLGSLVLDLALRLRWEIVNKKRLVYRGGFWRGRVYAIPKDDKPNAEDRENQSSSGRVGT